LFTLLFVGKLLDQGIPTWVSAPLGVSDANPVSDSFPGKNKFNQIALKW